MFDTKNHGSIPGRPVRLDPGILTYRIGQSDIEMSVRLDFVKTYAQGTPLMRLGVGDPETHLGAGGYITESREVDFGS